MSTRRDAQPATYPNLVNFLADHFGGYDSAAQAVLEGGYDGHQAFLADFNDGFTPAELAAIETLIAGRAPNEGNEWSQLRTAFNVDDCGNFPAEGPAWADPAAYANLARLVNHNN